MGTPWQGWAVAESTVMRIRVHVEEEAEVQASALMLFRVPEPGPAWPAALDQHYGYI